MMCTEVKLKKEKNNIGKLKEKSESEKDENEHELSFYINDRVKLMKEVLKIIKPRRIKSMAPDCIKDLDIEEINSMLLEELLGISNKRLKHIFNGQHLSEESSSTDPEDEKQPIDIISLDDVSDDDFVIEIDTDECAAKKNKKEKDEQKKTKIKKEKRDKVQNKKSGPLDENNLMSVLELLELQARARAIRSQLILEANKKNTQLADANTNEVLDDDNDDDPIIMEIPKSEEIIITSSDSENEQQKRNTDTDINCEKTDQCGNQQLQRKKIKLIRDKVDKETSYNASTAVMNQAKMVEDSVNKDKKIITSGRNETDNGHSEKNTDINSNKDDTQETDINDEDEIILIVDQEEMEGMIGE